MSEDLATPSSDDLIARAAARVVGGRACGSCTLCCKVIAVTDFNKLPGVWCAHCVRGKGCGIYETRPQICRDYTTDACEYDDDWTYDFYLETPEQVWEYTEAVLQPKGKSIRSPKPPLLPVL